MRPSELATKCHKRPYPSPGTGIAQCNQELAPSGCAKEWYASPDAATSPALFDPITYNHMRWRMHGGPPPLTQAYGHKSYVTSFDDASRKWPLLIEVTEAAFRVYIVSLPGMQCNSNGVSCRGNSTCKML